MAEHFYTNPILKGDYSDPDVIRVGEDYYMVSSSFTYFPGIPLLHSKDLVHWRVINHICRELPFDCYERPNHRNGTWAPSVRYQDGEFYVFVCTPDEGLFCFKAKDPRARFQMWHVASVMGWIDPCPFWDDDGQAYLLHAFAASRAGVKSLLFLHKMSADGTKILDSGKQVFDGGEENFTTEGPKMYKRGGYYYILAPAGGVPTGWQLAMRSKSPYGPYKSKRVLEQGSSPVNGPHQGGWVDTPSGQQWFIHFQDVGPYGRVPHLQPVSFTDGWPEMGVLRPGAAVGEPALRYPAPDTGFWEEGVCPQTSDDFASPALGLQWQWQANPRQSWYSLGENPGRLRLYAYKIGGNDTLCEAGQFLSQLMQHFSFDIDTKLTFSEAQEGDRAGLAMMCYQYRYIALEKLREGYAVSLYEGDVSRDQKGAGHAYESKAVHMPFDASEIYLRMCVREGCAVTFFYSDDGVSYTQLGDSFTAVKGGWVSARPGVFCANFLGRVSPGCCDFEFFNVTPK